ncbi:MAG TPA: hypothetical protein VE338_14435 [Ktedonobacterales bacterium]|jgi:hypothetical protein|nr:hypothetical protein [Ktedonobacterales bacterium]
MSQVISLRLRDEQMERVRRLARRLNKSASETAATLLEEALRVSEFAFIQFRDSPVGRQAYLQGSSLAVWEVVKLVRAYDGDVTHAAESLSWPEVKAQAALNYAAAYPMEIEDAIADSQPAFEALAAMLPGIERISASAEPIAQDRPQ